MAKDFREIIKKYLFLQNGCLLFSFTLPISLRLDNDKFFEILLNSKTILINSEELYTNTDSRFGEGEGIEVSSDTLSGFRYSRLNILLKDENPQIPIENLKNVYKNTIVITVNYFLDVYRLITGRFAIQIFDLDSAIDLNMQRISKKEKIRGMQEISFGKNACLQPCQPLISREEQERIEGFVKTGSRVSSEDLFLLNAKRQNFLGYNSESLISAVNALEITLNKKDIKIKYSFWERLCKIVFKNVYRELSQKKVRKLIIDSKLVNKINEAIKDRHRVAHGKDMKGNIVKHLEVIEEGIKFIKNL